MGGVAHGIDQRGRGEVSGLIRMDIVSEESTRIFAGRRLGGSISVQVLHLEKKKI